MRRFPKEGGQFAIIWADLLYEDAVPATGKLLFGEIYRRSDAQGWCDASNRDFMDLLGCSESTVRNLLRSLEDAGQICVETEPKRDGSGGTERRIFCGRKLVPPEPDGVPAENCGYPGGTRKNLRGVPAEICGYVKNYNNNKNNTPYSPPGGADTFDTFWAAYPRHTAKDRARKAWAKLNPDEALLDTILRALDVQRRSSQWTRDGGAFIPHPATWLNGRRWEDEPEPGTAQAVPDRSGEVSGWET